LIRFITEAVFVYCAVRTECLNINLVNFHLRRVKRWNFFWIRKLPSRIL